MSTLIRLFKIDISSAHSFESHLWLFKSRQIQIHRASNSLYLTNRKKRKKNGNHFHQAKNLSLHFVIHIDKVQSTSDINEALDEFPKFAFKSFFTVEFFFGLSPSFFFFFSSLCHWKRCVMSMIYDSMCSSHGTCVHYKTFRKRLETSLVPIFKLLVLRPRV